MKGREMGPWSRTTRATTRESLFVLINEVLLLNLAKRRLATQTWSKNQQS